MRKFIIKILVFIIPLIALCLAAEIYTRQIPNAYSYKFSYMSQNAGNITTLILGSSHTFRGIDPKYIEGKAFNLAYSSQDLKRDAYLLDRFICQMDSLQTVILAYSYHSMPEVMEDLNNAETLLKYYGIYMEYPETRYSLEISIPGWIKKCTAHWRGEDIRHCDSLGFGAKDDTRSSILNEEEACKILSHHTFKNFDRVNENKATLRHIATICKERNIRLVLLTTPVTSYYFKNISSKQYSIMQTAAKELTDEFDNVVYLNHMDDKRFSDSDFSDTDHLNPQGARKLTEILNEELRKIQ